MLAVCEAKLEDVTLRWDPRPAVCVVMASGGYPDEYEKGKVITGLEEAAELPDVVVFHAGTKQRDGDVVTNGGRVLGVTALGATIADGEGPGLRGGRSHPVRRRLLPSRYCRQGHPTQAMITIPQKHRSWHVPDTHTYRPA